MRKIILASHGSLAEGMQSAVEMIMGTKGCEAYGLDTYKEPERIYKIIEAKVTEEPNTQFIVITDINGGSVQNQMLHLCNYSNVFVQTGMCLSMVLEVLLAQGEEAIENMMGQIARSSCENMLGFSSKTLTETKEEELW